MILLIFLNEKIKMLFTWQNLKAQNNCIGNKNINTTTKKYEIKSTTNRYQLTTLNQNRGRVGEVRGNSCKQNLWILNHLIVLFTPLIIYTSLGNLKTIHCGNPKWRRSHYDGYMSIVTNKITISLNTLTNIIRSVDIRLLS